MEFSISFLEMGGNSEQNANVQIFSTLTQIRILRPFEEKNHVAQWRRVVLNVQCHLWNRGEMLNKIIIFKYFS